MTPGLAVPSPVAIAARSRLAPGDLAAIVRLHGREAAEHGLDASFEAEVARGLTDLAIAWRSSPDAGRLWLAGPPGDPLGSIAITRDRADLARLRWFMVAPSARRRGLGRRLLDHALAYVRARGFAAVELGTFSELTVAAAMYRRAGFELMESAQVQQWGRRLEMRKYRLSLLSRPTPAADRDPGKEHEQQHADLR
jgi:GNAT superfamily N-acetyltransferase